MKTSFSISLPGRDSPLNRRTLCSEEVSHFTTIWRMNIFLPVGISAIDVAEHGRADLEKDELDEMRDEEDDIIIARGAVGIFYTVISQAAARRDRT